MRKMKRLAALVLVFTMLVWMSTYAGAASFSDLNGTPYDKAVSALSGLGIVGGYPDGTFKPANPVTRAELAKILVIALGYGTTADVLKNATSSFSDVKAGDWFNGYVSVAASLGVVKGYPDGTFHPNDKVSYQDALVMMLRAGGFDAQAQAAGGYPNGYLSVGTSLGITNGTAFAAGLPATRGDIALMANFLVFSAKNPNTGKTLAESVFHVDQTAPVITLAGVEDGKTYGAAVTPVFVANEGTVTATLSKDGGAVAAFASGTAITEAGAYVLTVTATDAAGNTSTKTVSFTLDVWGTAAGVKIEGPASVVANGASKYQYTVKVVDKDGNLVKDYDGYVTVDKVQDEGAVTLLDANGDPADSIDLTVTDGTATFTVQSTPNADAIDTLKASLTDSKGGKDLNLDAGTLDVTSTAQTATSIKVTSDRDQLSADGNSYAKVTATVLDQAGKPIVGGSYELTFKVSGPGAWDTNGSDDPLTVYATPKAVVSVYTVLEEEGTITVSVSGEGLTGASTTISAYDTLTPAKIVVEADPTTIPADGSLNDGSITFSAKLLDRNGHLVTSDSSTQVTLTVDNKHRATLGFAATIDPNSTYKDEETVDRGIATFTAYAKGNQLGTATLTATTTITTSAGDKDISGSTTVQLVAGDPVAVTFGDLDSTAFNGDPVFVSITNPKANITAQLVDAAGNAVSQSGVTVYFAAVPPANYTAKVLSATKAVTDGSGKATVTATLPGYVMDTTAAGYIVKASLKIEDNGNLVDQSPYVTAATRYIYVTDASEITASASLAIVDTSGQSPVTVTKVTAGSTNLEFRATLKDSYQHPVTDKTSVYLYFDGDPSTAVKATWQSDSSSAWDPGYYVVPNTNTAIDWENVLTAGSHKVTVIDASMLNSPTSTRTLYVYADVPNKTVVLDSSGKAVGSSGYAISGSGVYGPFTLQLQDAYGNVAVAPANGYEFNVGSFATVTSPGAPEIRLSKDGAPVATLTIKTGASSVTFWVAVSGLTGTGTITFSPPTGPFTPLH